MHVVRVAMVVDGVVRMWLGSGGGEMVVVYV